ncbi:MAG: hypothetical protein CM1200mP20_16810 [Pseudomonadota bacterium]|nr:MAG: hypothetical protein CM1200mP20_16810 [Pseudomonadota bacterium]
MLSLTRSEQAFVFEDVKEAPGASLLRRFSAPVELETNNQMKICSCSWATITTLSTAGMPASVSPVKKSCVL